MTEEIKEFGDKGTPEASVILAVYDKEVHVAFSKNLDYDDLLDILETAAIMIAVEQQKLSNSSVH